MILSHVQLSMAIILTFSSVFKGVRQGENLSPILFSVFLNDLEHYLFTHNTARVDIQDEDLNIYLILVDILYADDTVIFADNEERFKSVLDTFYNYCQLWKLDIILIKLKSWFLVIKCTEIEILVYMDTLLRLLTYTLELSSQKIDRLH